MRATIITIILSALLAATCWGIGYTVFIRDQVIPEFNTIGTTQVLNPGDTPAYPATFRTLVCRPDGFSIYTSSAALRSEVWEDTAGTATEQQLVDTCPTLWNYSNPSTN
jgi:hypothetical protein